MALVVNTNIESLSAQRNLGINNKQLGKSITKLSSGLRLNSAADDAAGLSIATKFAAQVKGINQAVRNSNNAISLVQVAEGGINTITNILQRLRELAVQSASDDNTTNDRATLTKEADNLITELTRVATTSEFNTQALLDGSFKTKLLQIGANADQNLSLTIGDIRGKAIGGRAEHIANIAAGIAAAVDEGLGAGEVKVNGTDVAATNATDDQFSVFSLTSAQISAVAVASGAINLFINGTSVTVTLASGQTGAAVAASIVAAITAAAITNVTARTINTSGFVIEVKGGTNLQLAVSGTLGFSTAAGINSVIAFSGITANFAIGSIASAVTNSNGESSSIAKAVAVNAIKTTTTVKATAIKNITTASTTVAASTLSSGDVFINGIDIGAVTITANDGTGALATAINNKTGSTGVTGSVNSSGKLVLTAADGRNITVQTSTNAIATTSSLGLASGDVTNTSAVFRGKVRLNSDETFTLTATTSLADLDADETTSKSVAKDTSTFNINALKIDTQDNATAAILTIDSSLNDVNNLRADLGAIQNRIEFTISNLEIAGENTSASESRIRDADFASEVAKFTKNQILTQAATALLAQANTLPQIALQLLG